MSGRSRKRAKSKAIVETAQETVAELVMEPYVQACNVPGCEHVVVKVGTPSVDFTLCKARIIQESGFFRAAFATDNFKEGNEASLELKEEEPEAFLLFIQSMFPRGADDFKPMRPIMQGQSYKVDGLISLLRCADQYDAMKCASILQRIQITMWDMGNTKFQRICPPENPQGLKFDPQYQPDQYRQQQHDRESNDHVAKMIKEVLLAASKYNLPDFDIHGKGVIRLAAACLPFIYKEAGGIKQEILAHILLTQMKYLMELGAKKINPKINPNLLFSGIRDTDQFDIPNLH